jgi:tripartite-type tricarboxylate transporter receptor subunit TctC
MIDRRRLVALAASLPLAPLVSRSALAAAWPTRPVRVIVPYPAGGSTDVVTRITADRLSGIWNEQAVVENKPGASTNLAAAYVAHADPDGYTVLTGTSALAITRLLFRSLAYSLSDLAPVSMICSFPLLLLVPTSSLAKSVKEFIDFAKQNKGHVTYASPGVGTAPHLAGEMLKQMAGIEMTHVPYRGDAPALTDTIAGRVDLQIGGPAMLEQVRSGQVRALAFATAKRSPLEPNLPTVAEAGFPDFDVAGFFAFFVPAKTPRAIINKIHVDTAAVVRDPAVKAKFEKIGMVAVGSTPEELAAAMKAETDRWTPVIKEAKISLD